MSRQRKAITADVTSGDSSVKRRSIITYRSMTACWWAKSYRAFSKSNSTSSANVSASASASASASSSASAAAPPSGSSPPAAPAAAAAFFFFFLRRETTIDPSAAKPSSWFSTAWVIVTQSAM